MSPESTHRQHNVRHQVRKQVLFLSHTTLDLWHQCRSRAKGNLKKDQRFSLISRSDFEATVASKAIQSIHRRSVPQVAGFHVVCGKCDGFVTRNGVVRNCPHQRDSACNLSVDSRERGGEIAAEPNAQVRNDVQISVQPPTPRSSPELDTGGKSKKPAGRCSILAVSSLDDQLMKPEMRGAIPDALRPGPVGQKSQPIKPKALEPVPTVLQPGYVIDKCGAGTAQYTAEDMRLPAFAASQTPCTSTAVANNNAELFLHAGDSARENGVHHHEMIEEDLDSDDSDSIDERWCDSEALMQNWREWSERWERVVAPERAGTDSDQLHLGSEALMQEWREWSRKWESTVRDSSGLNDELGNWEG